MTETLRAKLPNAIHLYRHLLREATYLPPICQSVIEARIRTRYRKNRNDAQPLKRLRQARHDVVRLRGANQGDMVRMRKVMMVTFGRIGWRRHELMSDLLRPEQPDSSAELEDALCKARPARDWLDNWDTEKLLVFAKSQSKQNVHNSPRPEISRNALDPRAAVPPASSWGRPLSEKAARAKQKQWWKNLVHRVLPPVPRGEWELLRTLATMQDGAEWKVPERRPLQSESTPGSHDRFHWRRYAAQPIRVVERPLSRRLRASLGQGEIPPSTEFSGPAIGVHCYTRRFWQRLYAEIWQMTAVMERLPGTTQRSWGIQWGGIQPQPSQATAADLEFFEGVDLQGNSLQRFAEEHRKDEEPQNS